MASIHPCLLLFLTLYCNFIISQTYCSDNRKTYIVYMGDHPKDMDSTSIPSLHMNMARKVLGSDFKREQIIHSYKRSFNGFVVKLTKEEAEIMAEMDDVVSVFPNKMNKLHTTRSWDFLGFPQQVERTRAENDLIIGVIDSGITPESKSFNDKRFGLPPKKWKGACQNITCNNKIVGARYYRLHGEYPKDEFKSPIDVVGHGTHCASIAAGNLVSTASLQGLRSGTARGGVPSARIAVYKVCWTDGCSSADILAAFDDAVADGVDIITLSVGFDTPLKYFEDPNAIGAFHAMKKGILTSNSAGNEGPFSSTIETLAPWLLSVAASSIDIKLSTKVQLGNGMVFEGSSINTFDLKNKTYPLIYAPNAVNIAGGYNKSISRLCHQNSLDEKVVKGKIVLCDRYSSPEKVGIPLGAVGIIFRSLIPKDLPAAFAVPATHISLQDGVLLFNYINSTSNPTATIAKTKEGKDSLSPYIPSFSSRGPNLFSPNILKPDLAAPGLEIIAAWTPFSPLSTVKGDKRVTKYNIFSGTSMACPHAAAAAAYVKSFYPNWSPSAIKSALMTTATPMSADLNFEAEFAYGAGQLNPKKAVKPGLVYDASEADYVKLLCREGYDIKKLRILTKDKSTCAQVDKESVWDLNLPSFALFTNHTIVNHIFHRIVTNVGPATSTYKAIVSAPSLINIQVHPSILSFKSKGEKKSFSVSIEGLLNAPQLSASLVWDDGTFQVRSPIVIYA